MSNVPSAAFAAAVDVMPAAEACILRVAKVRNAVCPLIIVMDLAQRLSRCRSLPLIFFDPSLFGVSRATLASRCTAVLPFAESEDDEDEGKAPFCTSERARFFALVVR